MSQHSGQRNRNDRSTGYSSALAESEIFNAYPEPPTTHNDGYIRESGVEKEDTGVRFMQKHCPVLYMQLNPTQVSDNIADVQCVTDKCLLCEQLDRNTLDALLVLKPNEIQEYLANNGYDFNVKQINMHTAHTVKSEDGVMGVLQNMAIDLIGQVYELASTSSSRIMNRVTTDMGRVMFVTDHDHARVHNDAVKQFISLANTCQTLLKHKAVDDKTSASPLLS